MYLCGRALIWHTNLSEHAQYQMTTSLDQAVHLLGAEFRKLSFPDVLVQKVSLLRAVSSHETNAVSIHHLIIMHQA